MVRYGTGAVLAGMLGASVLFTALPVWGTTGTAVDNLNVRSSASASSSQVGSISRGQSVEVGEATTNEAGEKWYAVTLSGGTTGYVRADLLNVAEGTGSASEAGAEASSETPAEGTETATETTEVEVAKAIGDGYAVAMTPTNATVSQNVNVRSGAGTGYNKVGELAADTSLVVIGQAKDDADALWYQFYTTGTEQQMTGFIRYDYITLGEAVVTEAPAEETESEADPAVSKDYEAVYTQDENGTDTWYLYNNAAGTRKKIADIDTAIAEAQSMAEKAQKSAKTYRNAAVLLGIILVAAAAVIGWLILRLRRSQNERGEVDLMADRKKQERRRSQQGRNLSRRSREDDAAGSRAARPVRDRSAYPAGGARRPAEGDERAPRYGRAQEERRELNREPGAAGRTQDPRASRSAAFVRDRQESDADMRTARRPAGTARDAQPPRGSARSAAPAGAPAQNFANINTGELDEEEFSFLTDDDQ
ncbi:SH3 domain-containing protein [Lachnoclostridium sp. Marseille-P6806]|uniref:SH3 domain-containing protein n=1 Tax=Lachnoclostridium sp. Marseille-P6806 TaxID=2364793 RepID=UPI0013EF1DB6|nr:SH3 domain-containing protein [Lachnoclostridium sp. Marseille-P6806]